MEPRHSGSGESSVRKYFILSVLAGAFIALGGAAAMAVGGLTGNKLLVAIVFSSALSLCVMAGSSLFTGECLKQSLAVMQKKTPTLGVVGLLAFCWIGNLIGSWAVLIAYQIAGVSPAAIKYTVGVALAKAAETPAQCFFKAILCNICVCLAVWCCIKMQSEAGKLIMIFWCIVIFMVCGFEHSVANMSIVGLAVCDGSVSVLSYVYNLAIVTLGNAVGGVLFVALPYHIASIQKTT